jgi:putative FmdB family regulatory protein
MPIFEYKCSTCGRREERLQKVAEKGAYKCTCSPGGYMHPIISTGNPIFKGTGFYKTDYKAKST